MDKTTREEFGKELKRIRKEKNMTLMDLEENTGYSNSYLSQIENGHKNIPKPDAIRKLAKGLNIPYEELLFTAGYSEKEYYINDLFDDIDKHAKKEIIVALPYLERSIGKNGGEATKELSDDELRRRLFDLHDLLNMDIDLYYKSNFLSNEKRKNIKTMLDMIIEQ